MKYRNSLFGRQLEQATTARGELDLNVLTKLVNSVYDARVRDLQRAIARIEHLSLHDPLTNLPNRTLLTRRLRAVLADVAKGGCALLYLDLDRFKTLNDTLGHGAGDALLQQVAARLSAWLPHTNEALRLAAHLGRDEFAVLVQGDIGRAALEALAMQLVAVIGQPYLVKGEEVVVSASVGIASAPLNAGDADELLRLSSLALYNAKALGGSRHCFFEPAMEQSMLRRHAMKLDLRKAIASNQFELHYQPFVNRRPRRINGFEALLRWRHPTEGLIGPADFIPLAEEQGLIVPIGEWVLHEACKQAVGWEAPIRVAVNLSPAQFCSGNIVETVRRALNESGLASNRLELEVTESLMLEKTAAVANMLHQLRALGVSIAMDDFGSGYSSLGYLTRFPFDRIKIDKAFTRDVERRPELLAVIRAVVGICSSLGISCTAEGVETMDQLSLLEKERCDEMQGYLFSPPVPNHALSALFALIERGCAAH